mmetsp:Transcript_51357/g.170186  ORF Transcript_51357/g.170186 Transcript_51357/m.170186 type:complete len:242 (+) Transcript_51357:980-1705(+)
MDGAAALSGMGRSGCDCRHICASRVTSTPPSKAWARVVPVPREESLYAEQRVSERLGCRQDTRGLEEARRRALATAEKRQSPSRFVRTVRSFIPSGAVSPNSRRLGAALAAFCASRARSCSARGICLGATPSSHQIRWYISPPTAMSSPLFSEATYTHPSFGSTRGTAHGTHSHSVGCCAASGSGSSSTRGAAPDEAADEAAEATDEATSSASHGASRRSASRRPGPPHVSIRYVLVDTSV